MSRHSQSVLRHLLVQDGQRVAGVGFKNSVLIQVLRELDYVAGNTAETWNIKSTPRLTQILLFSSAVDLSGRILKRRLPHKSGEGRQFFVDSAVEWFGMNVDEAVALWNIRNMTSHQFNPALSSHLIGYIAPAYKVVDLGSSNGSPIIFTGSMISTIEMAMSVMWHELSNRTQQEKELDARFIHENCFFYSKHAVLKRKYHASSVNPYLFYRLKMLGRL